MISKIKKINRARLLTIIMPAIILIAVVGFIAPQVVSAQDFGQFAPRGGDPYSSNYPGVEGYAGTSAAEIRESLKETGESGPIAEFMKTLVGNLAALVVKIEGFFIWQLTKILLFVVKYNDFTRSPAVNIGWTLVRDVANMFFVVVLLGIAIATILRVESYNFKKLLPKVILMAILVNFSKTIAGLIIDFAQVVMLTFVAAFAGVAGEGNIVNTLQINSLINYDYGQAAKTGFWELTATAVIMVVMLLITIIVIGVMLVILVMRIVMLWVLVTLSPVAYILAAFPQGQRYAQQWWQEFSKYVIVGPVMAFFLWLTFAIASTGQLAEQSFNTGTAESAAAYAEFSNNQGGRVLTSGQALPDPNSPANLTGIATEISRPDKMLSFIIAIAMLMGGLVITQQIGVAGGQLAGGAFSKIRQTGLRALQAPIGAAGWTAKTVAKAPFQLVGRKVNEAIGEGRLPAWTSPAGMVRGWLARREELYGAAQHKATAAGQQRWEQLFTGTSMPRVSQLEQAEEAKFARDFSSVMDKEEMAKKAVELRGAWQSPEIRAKKRALVRAAAEQGYLDDLMAHPETKEHVRSNILNMYETTTDSQLKAAMDEKDEETGLSLIDRVRDNKGTWYDWNTLHFFLQDFVGGDEAGKNTINSLEDIAKKVNHPEYSGHATFRSSEEGGHDEMEMERIYDQKDATGKVVRKSGLKRMLTEFSKWQGRSKMGTAPHGFLIYNNDGSYSMGEKERLAATIAFGGQGVRIAEHSQDRVWKMLQGGSGDDMRWVKGYETAVADLDKVDGTPQNAINHARALAFMIKTAANEKDDEMDVAKAIWKKSGGETDAPEYQVNGKRYTVDELLKEFGPATHAGPTPTTPGPTPRTGPTPTPRMAMDFDIGKHNKTREQVERYETAGFNFYDSEDYLKQKDQFEGERDFRRHHAALNQEDFDKIRGVKTASSATKADEQAGVGVNFENSDIQAALGVTDQQDAVYYQGADKEMAVNAIVEQYRQQLTKQGLYKPEREKLVKDLRIGLQNAKTLRVHNNASLSSRLDQARHEKAHAQTRNLTDQQVEQIYATLGKKQQQAITKDIDKRYAGMTDIQKKKEALAEMVGVGKGDYAVSDKTAVALKAAGIKTRGEEVAVAVSPGAAAIRAAGTSVKQKVDSLSDSIRSVAASIGETSASVRQQTIGEIQKLYSSIKDSVKDIREGTALEASMKSLNDYNQAHTNRVTVEDEIDQQENQKNVNVRKYKEAIKQRDEATQKGESGNAFEHAATANRYIEENKKIDQQIKQLKSKQDQARAAEAKALTSVVQSQEKYQEISTGEKRPKATPAVKQAFSTVARSTNEAARQQAQQVITQAPVEEVTAAAQSAAKEEGKNLKDAAASSDAEAVVAALTGIENILQSVQTSLEKLSPGQSDGASDAQLASLLQQIRTSRTSVTDGGRFDPSSVSGLLRDVNINLTRIYRVTDQKPGTASTEAPPATPDKSAP